MIENDFVKMAMYFHVIHL